MNGQYQMQQYNDVFILVSRLFMFMTVVVYMSNMYNAGYITVMEVYKLLCAISFKKIA